MPPTPCPRRLQKLIDRVNKQSTSESHALRQILRAVQDRRKNKGPDTYAVNLDSTVTINLIDYSFSVRNELALALSEIDPPDKIDLIRECRVCNDLFWAGRDDKVVCDRHAEQWRKKNQRDRQKKDQARAKKEVEESKITKELEGMSRTAVALLNAIVFAKQRVFYKIDYEAWVELDENPLVRRVPNRRIVRQTLTMLVNRGYLTHEPQDDPLDDYYLPRKKLLDRWKPTH
jgi:hypothetical protein